MHPMGANRQQRRAKRERSEIKAHYTPPGSMVPHVLRAKVKTILDRDGKAVKVPTGEVEYVAQR